jgi:hypothetical protein
MNPSPHAVSTTCADRGATTGLDPGHSDLPNAVRRTVDTAHASVQTQGVKIVAD